MATSDEKPTTAVEAAVAPETADVSAEAQTTGTTSIVADIAAAASAVTSAAPTPGTATGTATPFELDEHQRRNSLNVTLADMCARGTALYAQKKYEDAAETFSRASEMQAEINGDMDPENAEILFLYGRAVFEVGKSKSDVLGDTPAPANEGAKKEKKADGAKEPTGGAEPEKIIGKAIAGASEETTQATTEDAGKKNPLLQFEGDEGYDDSDEEAVSSILLRVKTLQLTHYDRRRRQPMAMRRTMTTLPLPFRLSISHGCCSPRSSRPSNRSQIQRRTRVRRWLRRILLRSSISRSGWPTRMICLPRSL